VKFRYPLQKIVDLKGSEKSMAEWEYAAALGRLRTEQERFEQLRRQQEEAMRRLAERTLRPTPLAEIQRLQSEIDWLNQRMKHQRAEVQKAEEQSALRRRKLEGKMIDEKVWLKAREKAHERFRSEAMAREQNELDEIAGMRAASAARR